MAAVGDIINSAIDGEVEGFGGILAVEGLELIKRQVNRSLLHNADVLLVVFIREP